MLCLGQPLKTICNLSGYLLSTAGSNAGPWEEEKISPTGQLEIAKETGRSPWRISEEVSASGHLSVAGFHSHGRRGGEQQQCLPPLRDGQPGSPGACACASRQEREWAAMCQRPSHVRLRAFPALFMINNGIFKRNWEATVFPLPPESTYCEVREVRCLVTCRES